MEGILNSDVVKYGSVNSSGTRSIRSDGEGASEDVRVLISLL